MNGSLPIGVFDSGLGGLTVLKCLRERLPNENFVYLGDVARLPYGTKSKHVVEQYALRCLEFLQSMDVKLVVIACNTASAMALDALRAKSAVPVQGIIEPGVTAALEASPAGRLLVLGTSSTTQSGAYRNTVAKLSPETSVEELACPLLVPLAEQGWFDHSITSQVIETYLNSANQKNFDTIVLGCTHYPLLEKSFRKVVGEQVPLVHGGKVLASQVCEALEQRALLNTGGTPGEIRLYSTDRVSEDLPMMHALFGSPFKFQVVDL